MCLCIMLRELRSGRRVTRLCALALLHDLHTLSGGLVRSDATSQYTNSFISILTRPVTLLL
ncbi:hypothetical protein Plhal304r1_c078g0164851 [Plasmopara halstedii]